MIIFKTLRYKNLLSSGNVFTTIELNKHASTLIVGRNGAGKSTILDAICFALFGKPFRNVNKPQLVNSITKKNLLVELEFSIGSSDYTIRRGIKPAVFEVIKNGSMLNQSAESKDYQEILEKQILKLNDKSFRQIVILGSASFVPFMALTTGQRRAIIEDLLDLQIFTTMNVLLKARIADNSKLILEINSNIGLINEKIVLYNKHMIQVQKNNEELIANKQELIEATNAELHQFKDQSDKYQQMIDTFKERLASFTDQTKSITKLERLMQKLMMERDVIARDLAFYKEHENCPTCNQDIDPAFRMKTMAKQEKDLVKYANGIAKAADQLRAAQQEQRGIEAEQSNVAKFEYDQAQLHAEARSKAFYITQLSNDIKLIQNQHTDYNGARIDELSAELKAAETELEAAKEDQQTLNAAATLLKDTGIKSKIIKQSIPIINKLINKYLSALDFFVQFELNESFEETIKSRYRDEFSYESFSEGEKKRINLAIIFTWRAVAKMRNSANTNLFVLDEVFDSSLDLTGMEEVLKLLLSLSAENTFIISHNTGAAADKFDNVLRFEKRQNFSKMVLA